MDVTAPGRGARWDATWRMILRQEANVSAALSLLIFFAVYHRSQS